MARLNTPPTKSNLLRTKRDLATAREGFAMLDQKRQILVLELMRYVEAAKRVQQDVEERMAAAFEALNAALMRQGAMQVTMDATAQAATPTATVTSRSLMGIYLPAVSAQHPPPQPIGSLLSGSVTLDEAGAAFSAALDAIDRLAEVENSVFRLAREVRKTQRRVNALEKLFIPAYSDTVQAITESLEERERDEFVIMRMLKERLGRQRRNDG